MGGCYVDTGGSSAATKPSSIQVLCGERIETIEQRHWVWLLEELCDEDCCLLVGVWVKMFFSQEVCGCIYSRNTQL